MERTKFNVDKNAEKRSCDGIVFDSSLEMKYYRDVLRPLVESGLVKNYELQKKYILQEGFKRNGKAVLPITYIADFYIEYADGHSEVIDIKGCPDNVAKIKRKLFWYCYPDVDYKWIAFVKKFGGWGLYDEFERLRKQEKLMQRMANRKKEDVQNG